VNWREVRADERVTEWERADGNATIRLRRRPDDTWAVRLDRLHQAEDGRLYRRERATDEAAARDLVEEWMAEYGGD
jgi:hypothetical protein